MTFRRRHRYAAFRVLSSTRIGDKDVREVIQRSILELFGVYGLSTIEPKVLEYDEKQGGGIIRCNNLHLPLLRASLASITTIDDKPVSFFVLKVSGTLKALRREST